MTATEKLLKSAKSLTVHFEQNNIEKGLGYGLYYRHHAIVVTGCIRPYIEHSHKKAVEIFTDVSEIVESNLNNYASFFVPPDGSKEGWEESVAGDENRERFVKYLDSLRCKGGGPFLDWVELFYGDDNHECEIVTHSKQGYDIGAIALLDEVMGEVGWQDIETAPKDGSTVLLYYPYPVDKMDEKISAQYWGESFDEEFRWLDEEGFYIDPENNGGVSPTHWMPLPEPPEQSKQ